MELLPANHIWSLIPGKGQGSKTKPSNKTACYVGTCCHGWLSCSWAMEGVSYETNCWEFLIKIIVICLLCWSFSAVFTCSILGYRLYGFHTHKLSCKNFPGSLVKLSFTETWIWIITVADNLLRIAHTWRYSVMDTSKCCVHVYMSWWKYLDLCSKNLAWHFPTKLLLE